MGFGLLFIGYFFLLFFPVGSIGVLPNIAAVGCIIMFSACKRLSHYAPDCKGFKLARHTLIPYLAISLAELVFDIVEFTGVYDSSVYTSISKLLALASDIVFGVYAVFVMVGIYRLAKEVELTRLAARTGIVMSISVLFSLLSTVSNVAAFMGGAADGNITVIINYIGFAAFIFEYIAIFANLAHIFSCYMHICLEGDEDMPYREDIFDKLIAFTKRNKK